MSVPALGVDRVHGYPRVFVEPLLWLVVTSGVVWTLVAFDARAAQRSGLAFDAGTGRLAIALAVVLLVNGIGALLFASQAGSVSRALAMVAGVAMVVSSWALTRMPDIETTMRHKLVWGFLIAGILLTVLATFRWRTMVPPNQERGWPVSLAIAGLVLAALVLVVLCYRTLDLGLVAVPKGDKAAWGELVPWWMLLVGVLGTMEQVWSQRWLAAGLTLVAGAVLAAGVMPG